MAARLIDAPELESPGNKFSEVSAIVGSGVARTGALANRESREVETRRSLDYADRFGSQIAVHKSEMVRLGEALRYAEQSGENLPARRPGISACSPVLKRRIAGVVKNKRWLAVTRSKGPDPPCSGMSKHADQPH